MVDLVPHEVGKPWPGPVNLKDGMQVILNPIEDGLSMVMLAAVPQPTPKELQALREQPLRVGVYASAPLVWVLLDAGAISFDAPYAVGIVPEEDRAKILAGARGMAILAPQVRGLAQIDVIDPARGNRIEVLRAATLSAAWWQVFAAAIDAAAGRGPLGAAAHRAAIAADQRLSTREMFDRAGAVEVAGAV